MSGLAGINFSVAEQCPRAALSTWQTGHSLNTPVSRPCARAQTSRPGSFDKGLPYRLKILPPKTLRLSILTESIIFNCVYACICSKHAHLCACMLYICGGQKSFSVFSFICFLLIQVLIYLFILSFLRQDLLLNLELSNSARLASELQRLSCPGGWGRGMALCCACLTLVLGVWVQLRMLIGQSPKP